MRPSRVTSSGTRRSTPSLSGEALRAPEAAAARPSAGTLQTAPVPAKSDATGEVVGALPHHRLQGLQDARRGRRARGNRVEGQREAGDDPRRGEGGGQLPVGRGRRIGARRALAEPIGLREQDVEGDRGGAGVAQRRDQAGDGVARPRPLAVRGQAGFVDDDDRDPGPTAGGAVWRTKVSRAARSRSRSSAGRDRTAIAVSSRATAAGTNARATDMTNTDETSVP